MRPGSWRPVMPDRPAVPSKGSDAGASREGTPATVGTGGAATRPHEAPPAAAVPALGADPAYDVLRENVEAMREAIIFALDEGRIGDHLGHWDKTGGHGTGCPACIANREAKRRLREALPPRGAAS